MADKPGITTDATQNVGNLADSESWPFLNAFFVCFMREWFCINHYNVDGCYELINTFLSKYVLMVTHATSMSFLTVGTKTLTTLLRETVWYNLQNNGSGLPLHVMNKYIDTAIIPVLVGSKQLRARNTHFIT